MKPCIGITSSVREDGDYWIRSSYIDAVIRAGGAPVILPPDADPADALSMCGGIIISGGGDVIPELYGVLEYDPSLLRGVRQIRDDYEMKLAREAYELGLPMLGICRGAQVINAALGGTLHIDIPGHSQSEERSARTHALVIEEGSMLHSLVGMTNIRTNSFHHQAIDIPAPCLRVNAFSEDGIIEGAEASERGFCLCVQWHPEALRGEDSDRIFAALVAAAGEYRRNK